MKWPFLTYSFTLYVHQQGCRHSASWHVICGKAREYRRHTGPELVRPGRRDARLEPRSRQGSVHEARQGAPRKSHRPPRNRRSPRPGLPIRSVLECEQVRMLCGKKATDGKLGAQFQKAGRPRHVPSPGPGMTCCVAAASRCMDGVSGGSGFVKNSEDLRDQAVWMPPVYNKSPAAETIILNALESNILMKELSAEDRTVTLAISTPRLRLRPPPQPTFAQPPPLPRPNPTPTPIPSSSSPDADESHGYCQVQAGSEDHQAGRRGR